MASDRRCEHTQRQLSAAFDGEPTGAPAREHLDSCPRCSAFRLELGRLRAVLREDAAVPSGALERTTAAVMAAIPDASPIRHAPRPAGTAKRVGAVVIALAATAAALTASTAGAGADLADRLAAAQRRLTSFAAEVTVVEHGIAHTGRLEYHAPERFDLQLGDRRVVIADATAWYSGPDGASATVGRAPASRSWVAPAEVVLPVSAAVVRAGGPRVRHVVHDGEAAIAVTTTVAGAGPILNGLRPGPGWRPLHPTDRVELFLDPTWLTPLEVDVQAAGSVDRLRWAKRLGLPEHAGARITRIVLSGARHGTTPLGTAGPPPLPAPPPPAGAAVVDEGFRATDAATGLTPRWLPAGFTPYRFGTLPSQGGTPIAVATYTDGAAWISVRTIHTWRATRLFGIDGAPVRPLRLGSGVGYVTDDGNAVALHAPGWDSVVTGSVGTAELVAVAESLAEQPEAVPASWPEAAASTIGSLRQADPTALVPRAGRTSDAAVTTGAAITEIAVSRGTTTFTLSQARGDTTPRWPTGNETRPVTVRATTGSWSPDTGELVWTEGARLRRLQSDTLGLSDLLRVAADLRPAAS